MLKIIGLTLLSWTNNIGDLVGDIVITRKGIPRLAFSAAIAEPLFSELLLLLNKVFYHHFVNLLIGFGVPFLIVAARDGEPVNVSLFTAILSEIKQYSG
jgi:Ca2+/Na+ antiporter